MKYWKAEAGSPYGGFFFEPREGAAGIPDRLWQELLEAQRQGQEIVDDGSGFPVARTPERSPAQREAAVRRERDERIQAVEWRVRRHEAELALGLMPTEALLPLLAYIQALREVPQQPGFPDAVAWPVWEGS